MTALLEQLKVGMISASADETISIAQAFADEIPFDKVIALHGNLGAGKTTFIRGLALRWQIKEAVTSPTFNLFTIYQGSRQLIHLDAYRLDSGADLDTLMIEDFMNPPWCFAVEWPERIADSIPDDAWHLYLAINASHQHVIRLESEH